jgi:protein phosphatase
MTAENITTSPPLITAAPLRVPDHALVVLIGASGAGKSTFARRHFLPTEVISSDTCRGMVCDDENDQAANEDAFAIVHAIAARRLARRKLAVIDATNVQAKSRAALVRLAREHDARLVAVVLDLPEQVCKARNAARPDRDMGGHVIHRHVRELRQSLKSLRREGFHSVITLRSEEEVAAVSGVERVPLWCDRRAEQGPFDLIGDVHGCYDELVALLERLGYAVHEEGEQITVTAPESRRAIFLGDLVDRGPDTPRVLALVMGMVEAGTALCVCGNHDAKLLRALRGEKVQLTHGLDLSMAQLEATTPEFRARVIKFLDGLIAHYMLDGGALCVAHAGMKEVYQNRASGRIRSFGLYGETTGEIDEFGLPVRHSWAAEYRGKAVVAYGHTPTPTAEWLNQTICLDTGCVFGGQLTALRWPERELVAVDAARVYCEPVRPLVSEATLTAQQDSDRALDLGDLINNPRLHTRLFKTIKIDDGQAAAALEVMGRFAVDPRWLIYLPPTMSPPETHREGALLEHPDEVFQYYEAAGVAEVIVEAKHMGSRAVMIVCREPDVAVRRFGFEEAQPGVIYTRTGRRFFNDAALEAALLDRVRAAAASAGLWEALDTDWLCLDCELLPWSAKAQELLRRQYAAVGAASRTALAAALAALAAASARGVDVADLATRTATRADNAARFVEAYRGYCWTTQGIEGIKIAPFHLLASEGAVHTDRDHVWHMQTLAQLAAADEALLIATPWRRVALADAEARAEATAWWEAYVGAGGEGMVFKPLEYVTWGKKGLAQPAIKCRGPEYLRIIYGPDYDMPQHLARLRTRGVKRKRELAMRELALGIEGLERFVARAPLRKIHECAFGVLALESEPIDPRL